MEDGCVPRRGGMCVEREASGEEAGGARFKPLRPRREALDGLREPEAKSKEEEYNEDDKRPARRLYKNARQGQGLRQGGKKERPKAERRVKKASDKEDQKGRGGKGVRQEGRTGRTSQGLRKEDKKAEAARRHPARRPNSRRKKKRPSQRRKSSSPSLHRQSRWSGQGERRVPGGPRRGQDAEARLVLHRRLRQLCGQRFRRRLQRHDDQDLREAVRGGSRFREERYTATVKAVRDGKTVAKKSLSFRSSRPS